MDFPFRLSAQRYSEVFRRFREKTNEVEISIEIIGEILQRFPRNEISILSVGCADLEFDRGYLKNFRAKRPEVRIDFSGVEPNPNFNDVDLSDLDLKSEIFQQTVEKFLDQSTLTHDLIVCSHVFYYIEDRIAVIEGLLGRINSGGRLVILHQTPATTHSIQREMFPYFGKKFTQNLSNLDLEKDLESAGVSYQSRNEAAEFVSPILDSDLMSFLLETDFLALPENLKKRAFSKLKSLASSGPPWVFSDPVGVIEVEKTNDRNSLHPK